METALRVSGGISAHHQEYTQPCCAVALRKTAWSEHGMASVNQTRPHCVNQMGKKNSKLLAARHGRGMAWARHGHVMLCVNRPFEFDLISCNTIGSLERLNFSIEYLYQLL